MAPPPTTISLKTVEADGIRIFYREAGLADGRRTRQWCEDLFLTLSAH
ncbi:MAG: hypothetical protein JO333_11135 [Verrucomicrobia bacterium]|nr:hypothetical protein [Verrucomicrobiota bacterium]